MTRGAAALALALLFGSTAAAWLLPRTVSAEASPSRLQMLLTTKSLKCSFGPGNSGEWKNGQAQLAPSRFDVVIHFDSIDSSAGTARIIGNAGSSDAKVLATPVGLTIVEATATGNLVFATVFAEGGARESEFLAVLSRHMTFLNGGPLVSQYLGTCAAWN